MYILFFGGFIVFFDCVNFIMDLNKKNKKMHKFPTYIIKYSRREIMRAKM